MCICIIQGFSNLFMYSPQITVISLQYNFFMHKVDLFYHLLYKKIYNIYMENICYFLKIHYANTHAHMYVCVYICMYVCVCVIKIIITI